MVYVLVRTDHGRREYVTLPGSKKSHSTDIRKARIFPSEEAAQQEACPDNEFPVPLSNEMEGMQ